MEKSLLTETNLMPRAEIAKREAAFVKNIFFKSSAFPADTAGVSNARLVLICGLAGILTGCQSLGKMTGRTCCQMPMAAMPASTGMSVAATATPLASPAVWQDDAGKKFQLAELRGHPVVISMFYASCEGLCVITRNDMQAVEDKAYDARVQPGGR